MSAFRRWKRRARQIVESLIQKREAKIFVEKIEFSGGQTVVLKDSSILIIVGPNNAGKSSVLREIRDHLQERYVFGPVLRDAEIRVSGTVDAFKRQIEAAGISTEKIGVIKIGYAEYDLKYVDEEFKRGFVGSKVIPLLVSYLGAEERLQLCDPCSRGDYLRSAPKNPMQWLELDDVAEARISEIFEKTFGAKLVLNTVAGDKLMLHVARDDELKEDFENTRAYAKWLASLPRLHRQGDGMRSFAGTLMSLLVHPTTVVLLDEPEAFLHPPQVRKLAEVISSEVPGECQVIVATHNDAFLRALLDSSGDRVVLARIVRDGRVNNVTILEQREIEEIWNDPLLKTSDVLSALFHEAAIICEGESDARFYSTLLDAIKSENRDPDIRFYHFGGKDRIASIVKALRAVKTPVIAIVDIDILSDKNKFFLLFEALGGDRTLIEKEVDFLARFVAERKGQLTAAELVVELRRIIPELENCSDVSKQVRTKLASLGKSSSNWGRIKQDGMRALDANTFFKISEACKSVGLLINPEGELEGFCRSVPRTRKSEWLNEVIRRDFRTDKFLEDARSFATEIRTVARKVISSKQ